MIYIQLYSISNNEVFNIIYEGFLMKYYAIMLLRNKLQK